jgi:hypothetical protein
VVGKIDVRIWGQPPLCCGLGRRVLVTPADSPSSRQFGRYSAARASAARTVT